MRGLRNKVQEIGYHLEGRGGQPAALPQSGWYRKPIIVLALLLFVVGSYALSQLFLIGQSLRLDEAQSLWQTSHSIGGTLRVVAEDVHVPMYHVILHFWQLYFGNGIATARNLSFIFFALTIPMVYLLARQVLSTGWALFAAALFSFMPFMNWYANEARMYTLLALFATISQYYFIKLLQGKKDWFGFGSSAVVGAYSHYFFSFNLVTQAIFYLVNRKMFAAGSFKKFAAVGAAVVVGLLPWLYYFQSLGSAKNTTPQLVHPSSVDFFNAFSQFFFGFQTNHINTVLVSCWPLVILVAFFAIKRGQRLSKELNYLITAGIVPVVLAYVLSFVVSPFFVSRYMLSSVAPLIIVIVWFISNYRAWLAAIASAFVIAALVATSIAQDRGQTSPIKEDYAGAAAMIAKQSTPSDVVVLTAPFTVYPFEYYYNGSAQIKTLPNWDRRGAGAIPPFVAAKLPGQVRQINYKHNYAYLVLSQNQGYETTIKQYYLQHFKKVSQRSFSPGLQLYVFQVGYYNVPPLGSPDTIIKPSQVIINTDTPDAQ